MDSVSKSRLALVHPLLATKIQQMYAILALGIPPIAFRVTRGLASWKEQAALWSQGRTTPGAVVTDAPAGHSAHNFGYAVDLVPMIDLTPDWNVDHPVWKRMIEVGDSLGLVHVNIKTRLGAHRDWPHFQLPWFPVVPDDEMRQLFKDGGVSGVWAEYKAPTEDRQA